MSSFGPGTRIGHLQGHLFGNWASRKQESNEKALWAQGDEHWLRWLDLSQASDHREVTGYFYEVLNYTEAVLQMDKWRYSVV